ncbi:MAG: PorT family protein [Prevotellaceae bacterium]|nr:PorT family protein [Prevotellaceae bacterium]
MKSLLFPLLLVCGCLTGAAQVQLSVQGGVEMPDLTGNHSYQRQKSYRVGVHLDLPLAEHWAFRTGAQVVRKKWGTDDFVYLPEFGWDMPVERTSHFSASLTATYLEIPLKMVATIALGKVVEFKLNGGVYVGYGLTGDMNWKRVVDLSESVDPRQRIALENDYPKVSEHEAKTFGADNFKRFEIGPSVGADLYLKFFYVGGGIEYSLLSMGIMPQNLHQHLMNTNGNKVMAHNFSIELHAGLRFRLGRN